MRIYEDYDWSASLLDEQLIPYQWTDVLSSTYLKQLEMSSSDDEPTQSWSTFLDFVLSRLLFSCTVVTEQVTPQFEYEGMSWQPSVRLQKCFKLCVFFAAFHLLQSGVSLHSSNDAGSVVMTWELWQLWVLCWHWYDHGRESAYMQLHIFAEKYICWFMLLYADICWYMQLHIFAEKDICWFMQPV